tara:strand:+ start:555 stop:776 length:222 start_codon:yes stop_codon:yes gene_type:complete
MKVIVLISTLIFLTGCAIQDCKLRPHVDIVEQKRTVIETDIEVQQKEQNKSPASLLKEIQDNARPGGEMVCTY